MKSFFSLRVFFVLILLVTAHPSLIAMNPFAFPSRLKKTMAKPNKSRKIFIELEDFTGKNYYLHKGWYTVQDLLNDSSTEAIEKARNFFNEYMRLSEAHKSSASHIAFKKLGIQKITDMEQAKNLKNIIYELTASACCFPPNSPCEEPAIKKLASNDLK